MQRAANEEEKNFSTDVRAFVKRDFYVDDALKSFPSEAAAIDFRLCTIISNPPAVTEAFHVEDYAVDIKDVDLFLEDTSVQRNLGVSWNIASDTFTF